MPALPSPAAAANELYDLRERARIVAAAKALYISQGILNVTMLDIAHYVRLPEHAVRRWFPTPEPLALAVAQDMAAQMQNELQLHRERCTTAVEELLSIRNWVSSLLQAGTTPFFKQLEAGYPEAWHHWHSFISSYPQENLRRNLHWGIQQGLYPADLDVEARLREMQEQPRGAPNPELPDANPVEAHHHAFNAFLASVVTPAGALVARRLQEAAPYY